MDGLSALSVSLHELLSHPALSIAYRQRAKFEGWLKIELAHALAERGCQVQWEVPLGSGTNRADLSLQVSGEVPALLMLKTVNTNYREVDEIAETG